MKQIEPQAMLERIRPKRLCYLQECMDLSLPEKIAQWAIQCYANEDETCLAVTWNYPAWNVASFVGYDKNFIREVLRQFDNCKECTVGFSLPPGGKLPDIKLRGLRHNGVYESFTYEADVPDNPIEPHIQLLEKEQFALLQAVLPDHDNLDHQELALAWLENGQPMGYISFGPMFEDIWDVGNIFTLPEYRNRGIGAALAYAYLKTMRARGLVPYYSGVSNPYSAEAARKAGFRLCCTSCAYKYKRPKFRP